MRLTKAEKMARCMCPKCNGAIGIRVSDDNFNGWYQCMSGTHAQQDNTVSPFLNAFPPRPANKPPTQQS